MPKLNSFCRDSLVAWIDRRRIDDQYAYCDGEPGALLATCFAVLASEAANVLCEWEESRFAAVSSHINSFQDKNGLFGTGLVKPKDLVWKNVCDRRYVELQITYFALSALRALGREPKEKLSFLQPFHDLSFARGWIAGGNWHDPWNMSNRAMFIIRFLLEEVEQGNDACQVIADQLIHDLKDSQDPRTGFWHGDHESSDSEAAFAAYHFFPFMFYRGIVPNYIEQSIDTVLGIQNTDGHYGPHLGGGACEDLDAIHILVTHSLICDHRQEDVRESLLKSHRSICALQNSDGGFPNYTSTRITRKSKLKRAILSIVSSKYRAPATSYYSGWKKIGSAFGKSDMWGTWFRMHSLQLIESRYPDVFPEAPCVFHEMPALGWHCVESVSKLRKGKS